MRHKLSIKHLSTQYKIINYEPEIILKTTEILETESIIINTTSKYKFIEPYADLSANSKKVNLKIDNNFLKKYFFSTLSSLLLHFLIFLYVSNSFFFSNVDEVQSIELSFGLDSPQINTKFELDNLNAKIKMEEPTSGQKLSESLPKIPKKFEIQQLNNDLPKMSSHLETNKVKNNSIDEHSKPSKKIMNKISKEEFLKHSRKQMQSTGNKNIDGDPFSKLPPSVLNSSKKESTTNSAPVGVLEGKALGSIKSQYAALIQIHIKKQWLIETSESFDPNLKVSVQINLSPNGYIVGKPILTESSMNKRFDDLVVKTIIISQPFPVMPKELENKIQTITLKKFQPPQNKAE